MKLAGYVSVCVGLLWFAEPVNGGNILVWHTEGSHWINLKPVLNVLMDRGHNVTVLIQSATIFMNPDEPSRFNYEPFNVTTSSEEMNDFLEEFIQFSMYEMDHLNLFQLHVKFVDLRQKDMRLSLKVCAGLLQSDEVMGKLRSAKYDLLLADPIYYCSDLLADVLDIPLVYTLRFSNAFTWERLCGQMPAPPSYVPGAMIKYTDQMSFSERFWNFLFYASQDVLSYHMWRELDRFYSEVKGEFNTEDLALLNIG